MWNKCDFFALLFFICSKNDHGFVLLKVAPGPQRSENMTVEKVESPHGPAGDYKIRNQSFSLFVVFVNVT